MINDDIYKEKTNYKIKGHIGTWYSIAKTNYTYKDKSKLLYIMEHEEYGGAAAWVIIDSEGNIVLEDVYNGWDDLQYVLEEGDLEW